MKSHDTRKNRNGNIHMAAYVPVEIEVAISAIARARHCSRSEAVRNALEAYAKANPAPTDPWEETKKLQAELESLKAMLKHN